ncbi:cold-shock protein [Pseudomonas muyukensis]|uniref:Cold shock domain-containing protein n=1 Tax=Pseudomonas muyukensis TaxID=2842357 RepID=A0ABX8M607_9PSED|nr:cold shock domain-containing protein [Pseudomonas muyukensis]QXH33595.1 cold shock domain-containing protein [Pseudomonas muyukensis]
MNNVKTAKVKMYNASEKSGFLDYEIDGDDVILRKQSAAKFTLKSGDEVTFETVEEDGSFYAINVKPM